MKRDTVKHAVKIFQGFKKPSTPGGFFRVRLWDVGLEGERRYIGSGLERGRPATMDGGGREGGGGGGFRGPGRRRRRRRRPRRKFLLRRWEGGKGKRKKGTSRNILHQLAAILRWRKGAKS